MDSVPRLPLLIKGGRRWRGGGGGRTFQKLSHLEGTKNFAGKGDSLEKVGLM